ncbi:MAG: sodium:solute symporter family protein [Lachnospiraceae bacterium]|nr:sodium:solute symporter family protein [Lachnospiraceae bacterium]
MNIFLVGVIVSIIIYMVVGVYVGRSVKNVNDYYVSGRNAPTILIAGTLFASMLSVNGFMGDQGWCYSGNITSLVLLNAMCACGYVFGPLCFGRYLRRSECTTMPEYFGMRYKDPRIRRVAGVITIISLMAYLLASITGVGILMQELTGFSYHTCLFLAWACFTMFTFYSGSKGVVLTDTLMFIIFLFGAILAGPIIFKAQGGLPELLTNLMNNPEIPEGLLDFHGNIAGTGANDVFGAVMYAVTMGIIWFITVAVSPWQAGRNLMAKSEHVTFRSGVIAAICTVVFLLFLNLQSVAVLNLNAGLEDSQRVLIWASYNVLPKIVGTLLLSGIMAAGLSSASTFLSVIGFSLTSDIVQKEYKNEKQQLRTSRIVMLLVGVVSLILAYMGLGGIRIISWFASTIIAASWAVPGIGSILSKKMSRTGARWSMIAGFLGFIITKCMVGFGIGEAASVFVNFLDPFFIGLFLSFLFAVLGSKLYPVSNEETEYRKNLMVLPESEKVASDYKRDRCYAYILIIVGILTTCFLLFGWALPYNGIV